MPNVELVYATEIYTARIREVEAIVPSVKTALDYRRMLDEKDIDAVLIATPQHLPFALLIPNSRCRSVTKRGGIYLWKDGREVTDTRNVTMEHPEEILFS